LWIGARILPSIHRIAPTIRNLLTLNVGSAVGKTLVHVQMTSGDWKNPFVIRGVLRGGVFCTNVLSSQGFVSQELRCGGNVRMTSELGVVAQWSCMLGVLGSISSTEKKKEEGKKGGKEGRKERKKEKERKRKKEGGKGKDICL
jgi:hypothetical protein